eukprot:c10443_g1_i3.p1 GENE.c10443_g1_i3~~c10443_g1_i3.p1  ORF type:complete len:367 (+),score=69.79 c10443_g1_i3:868-1968(+)
MSFYSWVALRLQLHFTSTTLTRDLLYLSCRSLAPPLPCSRWLLCSVPEHRSFCQCVVMSIAFACNLGGIPTPIASPQNAAALDAINGECMDVSFIEWMGYSLPITVPALLITWVWLQWFWKPTLKKMPLISLIHTKKLPPCDWRHWFVGGVSVLTVMLWCTFELTKSFFGSLGLIALVPLVLLYGSQVLATEELKHLDWNILMLLGGGSSLGDAVKSSELLDAIADQISSIFGDTSHNSNMQFVQFMFFNIIVLAVANFISHTVAAITMMPVIARVGSGISRDRTVTYVLGSVVMDSGACALPVSSFPNVLAYALRDPDGDQYLTTRDFLKAAVVVEVVMIVLMATIGWQMNSVIKGESLADCDDL